MGISSQQLEQFLAIYRAGSLGRASRALGLTQPALSKTLRRLEDQLKVQLFERRPSGLVPSPFADALARRAEAVCAEVELAEREIAHLRDGAGGEIRLGASPAIAAFVLPEVLGRLLERMPALRVSVMEGLFERLAEEILAGTLDFAITTRPFAGEPAELELSTLCLERFVVAARPGHPLAGRTGLGPGDFLGHPWVLPPRTGLLWQQIEDRFAREGLAPPEPRVETNSAGCMTRLVEGSDFLTLVPEQLIAAAVAEGRIAALPVRGLAIEREVSVALRRNAALAPSARALLRALRAAFARSEVVHVA